MALSNVVRVRIILYLLKTGDVTTEANYGAGIDKVPIAIASRYGDDFLKESGATFFDGATPPQPRVPVGHPRLLASA